MNEINKDNKIFFSKEFQDDKYKFYIIQKNLTSDSLELYSDESNYIICRGRKDLPIWIWTKDNFDNSIVDEIKNIVKTMLVDGKTKLTCKKELYDLLVQKKFDELNKDDYFEMGFLICKAPKEPKKCDGILYIPNMDDLPIITQYIYDSSAEMNGVDNITMEEAENKAIEYIEAGKFYTLKNTDGKIICMAGYNTCDNQAKIGAVYTIKEERKKGYAANLIYLMCKDIISKGYISLLYTDYNYIPSNRAYINAGFEDTGILINFSCSKTNIKNCK